MQYRAPWDPGPPPEVTTPAVPEPVPPPAKRRGRRPAPVAGGARPGAGQGPWLYHHLTITGPADRVAGFADAARGAGIVPWRLDGARIEEDIFHLAVSQPKATRSLSLEGCRILARQFRERAEVRAAQVAARVGQSHTCPFDLHQLLPVPADILTYELTHPKAQAWLREHWGLREAPRQVVRRPEAGPGRRLPAGHVVLGYGFFTSGETPHTAIERIATAWPDLRFQLQPRP